MDTALLLLCLLHHPCLPDELGSYPAEVPADDPSSIAAPLQPIDTKLQPPSGDNPGPFVPEKARYRVTYGWLGEVAEATLTLNQPADLRLPARLLARGEGRGDVLGFGKTEKRLETEFDTTWLGPTKWSSTRHAKGVTTVDVAEQSKPGEVSTTRRRQGQADHQIGLSRATAILDPLGFLLRIRMQPPTLPAAYEVLDGRGFWQIRLTPEKQADGSLLRFSGRAEPLHFDGAIDSHRTARNFTLFLSSDPHHVPVKLVVPTGLGEVRAELVEFSRLSG